MANKRKLNEEYTGLSTIKTLVETYQEIAAIRMQKVRSSVLNNREFLDELNAIYHQLRYSYDELKLIGKNSKEKKNRYDKESNTILRNGKTIVVLLSANTGLYGDIIRKTFTKFTNYIINNPEVDIAVIGRRGLSYLREAFPKRKYEYYQLEDHIVNPKEVTDVVNNLVKYEKVVVFHGKYESILNQMPMESNISGELPYRPEDAKYYADINKVKYLYEPSLDTILNFFETEIMASIFEQTVYESNLSKFAARMITLDASVVSISDKLVKVKFLKQQLKHREYNRKQLSAMAGISLWK